MSPEQRQMRAAADEARTAADERAAFEQWQAMHPETQTWANRMQEVMSARSQGRKPGEYKVETKPDEAPLALQRGGRKSTGTARSVAMRKRQ
jgi:hypothetical protein